jgi:ATP-dependent RNA helicase DOB1
MYLEEDKYDIFDDLQEEVEHNIVTALQENDHSQPRHSEVLSSILFEPADFDRCAEKQMEIENAFNPSILQSNLEKNCILETIVRPGLNPEDFKIDINSEITNPAKTYKFELDPFQKAAVRSIEKNESVLVAAHTSAGKTAVAEYVIAQCLKNNQRVIYTSPIKALSNQKYRDLKAEFKNVGLITGDVTIDENQTCLVMTTEILRNMLFRSNEVAKETAWIIFDEVHYMKDRDRGVVWEETIILAPKMVRFCLLSATTPNASELAQWILKIKDLDCINVVYTDFRPVPLEYFGHMSSQKCIHLLKNTKGELNTQNIGKLTAMSKNNDAGDEEGGDVETKKKRKNPASKLADVVKILKLVRSKQMIPAIIFAFSKKEVEMLAKSISKSMELLEKEEKNSVAQIFESTMTVLSEEDRKLPQIQSMIEILKSGVGLHHGGMLPILKELVEILFQLGLVKVLVSTETFSMGVNMPARSVIFSSVQKWDGEKFRVLSGSEFVQMAGRAGRRGLDDRGFVITMLDETIDLKQFIISLRSESKFDPLISQFDISYNMLLNSLMMEGFEPEEMVRKSFKQFQFEMLSKKQHFLLVKWKQRVSTIRSNLFDKDIQKFYSLIDIIEKMKTLKSIQSKLSTILVNPRVILPFLNIGRLLLIPGCGWVPFLNFTRVEDKISLDVLVAINYTKHSVYKKKVLCSCFKCVEDLKLVFMKEPAVITVDLKSVRQVSSVVITLPENLITLINKTVVKDTIGKAIHDFDHKLPLMRLIDDIPITKADLREEVEILQKNEKEVAARLLQLESDYKKEYLSSKLILSREKPLFIFKELDFIDENLNQDLETSDMIYQKGRIEELFEISTPKLDKNSLTPKKIGHLYAKELRSIKLFTKFGKKLRNLFLKNNGDFRLVMSDKMLAMRKILKRLEFVDKNEVVTSKGRIGSLLFGSDELLLTELVFSGFLSELNAKQSTIFLSLFVNEEKPDEKQGMKIKDEQIFTIFDQTKNTLKFLCKIYIDAELEKVNEEEMVDALNPSFFEIIQRWYEGATFLEVCKKTPMYEGSIIRGIKRLYELLKELIECADVLGNKELKERFTEGSSKLFKGIVFTASLYL